MSESQAAGAPLAVIPPDELLPRVFARAAAAHPDRTALEVPPGPHRPERVRLSYADLDRRAEEIAVVLAPHVAAESVVAILLPRTNPDLVAAQLAVLRSGAAFTSIDPHGPDAHVRFVVEDSGAACLVADAAGHRRVAGPEVGPLARVDVGAVAPSHGDGGGAPTRRSLPAPGDLAYVIYTSGTTGRPKGVMIEHGGVANLVASDVERFRLPSSARVAQGSSAAYDSSIEETWLAFAAGGTLVVMDEETSRLGPDLPAWLRAERITVLCPPPTLLRAMGLADPRAALPDLSLLYVGGEALERDVADRWAPGRWMENGYGPTECTVTVLRGRVREGELVTIGRPIRGHRAHVLDERLEEAGPGEAGELAIEGVGVARGYLGRPDLTAERFPVHPRLGRLYRTGDLVRRGADGQFLYLGRMDAQVKIRGHRIELGAVESALASLPGVREAACRVQGSPAGPILAAFAVPSDSAHPPRWDDLEPRLRRSIPAPMIPARFALLAALPKLTSGKLDRAALPEIAAQARTGDRPFVAAADEVERVVAEAFRATLGLAAPVSAADDFFLDLGGDSVGAAQVVSRLRGDARTAASTVRDLYAGRTAAALAARARAGAPSSAPEGSPAPPRGRHHVWFTAAQALWLSAGLVAVGALLYAGAFLAAPFAFERLGLLGTLVAAPLLGLVAVLASAVLAVLATALAKRVLIGRYRPLRAPVWSGFHLRLWMVERVARLVPWRLLADTVFSGVALRALGARVGRDVHIHRGVDLARGGWDLLSLGDEASLGQEVALRLVSFEEGHIVVGPVTIGARATLETRSGVEAHAEVGPGASLAPLSWLPSGAHIPAGERFDGVPARSVGRAEWPEGPAGAPRDGSPVLHGVFTLLLAPARWALTSAALLLCAWLSGGALGLDLEGLLRGLYNPLGEVPDFARLALLFVVALPTASIASAIGMRLLGRVRPGVFGRFSAAYLRVLAKTGAVTSAGTMWSGTIFWPLWLRLAGMRVGRGCEISTIVDTVPDLVTVGPECFLADGVYLAGPRVRGRDVWIGESTLGRDTFVGNHAVVHTGSTLPDDILIGVSTVADETRIRPGSAWFGHPAFELPRSPPATTDRRLTHDPSPLRYATRFLWESARVLLPIPPLLVAGLWLHVVEAARASGASEALLLFAWAPGAAFGGAASLVLLVVAIKWLLLGRVKPGRHALWSCWCSRWDFLYVAWGAWARRGLSALEGTLLLGFVLRATGMRIGRRVVLGSGFSQVVDPDMIEIGDDATVHALFQAHSFEDRMLKIDRVRIGRGASVGAGAVVFYGASIGEGARVAPHSVVMKHESLTAGLSYAGCPTDVRRGSGVS